MMTSGATLLDDDDGGACDRDGDGLGGWVVVGAGDVPDAVVAFPHAVTNRNRAPHSAARM
jgi:hypothetical protein